VNGFWTYSGRPGEVRWFSISGLWPDMYSTGNPGFILPTCSASVGPDMRGRIESVSSSWRSWEDAIKSASSNVPASRVAYPFWRRIREVSSSTEGSSSTTRIVCPLPRACGTRAIGWTGAAAAAGNRIRNVAPMPGSDSTLMLPRALVTMPCTVASPRPVPLPIGLVVKKGSKMRSATSALMPFPVSLTTNST